MSRERTSQPRCGPSSKTFELATDKALTQASHVDDKLPTGDKRKDRLQQVGACSVELDD